MNIKPEAFIFDWDDTLVVSLGKILDSLSYTFQKLGLPPVSREDLTGKYNMSSRNLFPTIFGDKSEEANQYFYDHYVNNTSCDVDPKNHAEELLELITEMNIYCVVISNKRGDILRKEISRLKWDKYFAKIIGSQDLAEDKPSPLPVFEAMKDRNIKDFKNIWFLGDSNVDLHCAINANCTPIFLGSIHYLEDFNLTEKVKYNILCHSELIAKLKNLA